MSTKSNKLAGKVAECADVAHVRGEKRRHAASGEVVDEVHTGIT